MTNLLIRLFVPDSGADTASARAAYGRLAGVTAIICNTLLFALKLTAGILFGSLSVTADGINNLFDASSGIINILGFKMASKPADAEHPYGHARYEYLAGLFVSVLIIVIGVELLKDSVARIIRPSRVEFGFLTAAVLLFSIALKLWLARFNSVLGKRINSKALAATAADSRNDVISTSAVLIAAAVSHFTPLELDGWMGLAVAAFILYGGAGLIKDTLDPLLGNAPDPELAESIRKKILSYPGVLGTHDLLLHDYGPGRQFASVHVEMSAKEDVIKSHDIIDSIEHDFLENDNLHMIVHYDPIVTEDAGMGHMRACITKAAKSIDESISIHDIRLVPGKAHPRVIFDCVIPPELDGRADEIRGFISGAVSAEYPNCRCVINLETGYAAMPHD